MRLNFNSQNRISQIKYLISFILFFIMLVPEIMISQTNLSTDNYKYLYPVPNSIMVSHKTNVIIRYGEEIQGNSVDRNLISVTGSAGGSYSGKLVLSDDNKTLVFNPSASFEFGEIITVTLRGGIRTVTNSVLPECSFNFTIVPGTVPQGNETDYLKNNLSAMPQTSQSSSSYLPAPKITVDSVNNPSPGYIFLATWDRNAPNHVYGNYIFILNSTGGIVDSVRINGAPFDFKIQSNGYLSYAKGDFSGIVPGANEKLRHYVMDSTFAVVDSFQMKNGYETDFHEFLYMPNGHAFLMSYHKVPYDMSKIVAGGKPNAVLTIDILQEQDRNKNVVFEWRTLDYIPITKSSSSPDSSGVDLTQQNVHPWTLNGFDLDNDGNILASFREFSSLMKISRSTGEILWRMGGKSKEFTFINENQNNYPFYYSRQHDVRRLANGNISIFDNGDRYKNSRAVEYKIDEINKTATLVNEFRYPSSLGKIASALAGNAQKLSNGGWFVCYGMLYPPAFSPARHSLVESHSDGSLALVISLPTNILSYHAYKLPWKELVVKPFDFFDNLVEGNSYPDNNHPKNTGIVIRYDSLSYAPYMGATLTRVPYGPVNPVFTGKAPVIYPVTVKYENFAGIQNQKAVFNLDLTKYPGIKHPASTSFYIRNSVNSTFELLPTTYNSITDKLSATVRSFGEIVFGEPDVSPTANVPLPFEPARFDTVKVSKNDSLSIKWTGQGLYDFFRVQVSQDSLFNNMIIDTTLNSSYVTIKNLAYRVYYWRVASIVNSNSGAWTESWSFSVDTTSAIVGVNDYENSLPLEYNLYQNYPNPFNPATEIKFSLPKESLVKLEVFNIIGQKIAKLIDNTLSAGTNSIHWNAGSFASGIYFYKIEAVPVTGGESFRGIKKMILMK